MGGYIGDIGDEQGREDVQGREDKVSAVDSCSLVVLVSISFQIRHHAFHFGKVGNNLNKEIQGGHPATPYHKVN